MISAQSADGCVVIAPEMWRDLAKRNPGGLMYEAEKSGAINPQFEFDGARIGPKGIEEMRFVRREYSKDNK